MFRDNLIEIKSRYDELNSFLSQPDAMADQQRWKSALKEQSDLTPMVENIELYLKAESDLEGAREIMQGPDRDLAELAQEEVHELTQQLENLEEELKLMLIPSASAVRVSVGSRIPSSHNLDVE